ncbi:efflux RND transporter periplasmic adaptor subunit [Xanthomonas axonopodis]|uniref:Acriflavin resistance protein n=1 Tax=Xanthomonas axonopodis pv. cajani TaxID=487827 RepID=A0ABX3MC87_9XANT|nr:efflux RND transporter periplasmic adaptor subunit [Xanthomonas axonopodis]OOX13253.1 acriflavin resistance protein [Xanthomonas axonopodis pv. cajani]
MSNAELLEGLRIDRGQENRSSGRPWWPWILVLIVILVIAAVAVWFFFGRAISVKTTTAATAASSAGAGAVLQATGYITARRQATVSAQITGTLTAVLIEEGDRVTQNQVLARLDDSQYKAALDTAVAQAQAAHAQVRQYEAQLAQDLRDADRNEQLTARGMVSGQTAEQARTQAHSTQAQLTSQQKQAVAADAQVAEARVNYNYCVVRAPFDGVITTKDAQVGEIVSPFSAGGGFTRTGIGTIVDMSSLEVDVDVDVNEAYIGRVTPDMASEAVLDAYPDWRIPAHVIAIVPAADRGKATVKVRVALESKDARIVPDMGVRVSFLDARPDAKIESAKGVLVPSQAIVKRDGADTVFVVVDDGKVRAQRVTAGAKQGNDMRLIPSGVATGDRLVISPPDALHDGASVRVQE